MAKRRLLNLLSVVGRCWSAQRFEAARPGLACLQVSAVKSPPATASATLHMNGRLDDGTALSARIGLGLVLPAQGWGELVVMAAIGGAVLAIAVLLRSNRRAAARLARAHRDRAAEREALEARVESALEGIGAGLWDWSGSSREAVLSRGATQILGHTLEEIGPPTLDRITELIHPEDLEIADNCLRPHPPQARSRCRCEIRMRHARGRWVWVLIDGQITERSAGGDPIRMVGTLQDVTARREAEIGLCEARQATEGAKNAKSEFLAMMTHEIRTPLNSVIGLTGLLLDSSLSSAQRRYAEAVVASGESLLTLINSILDFSKIETGRLEMELGDFDLRQTLDESADLLAHPAQEKGLEYVCLVDSAVPSTLRGDPGRLRQIITNLVANATKFTEQGEIIVDVRLEKLDSSVATLRVEVSDTGMGVPEHYREALFSPFVQADGTSTRRHGGVGLGLTICKQLVEMMGGEIGMRSQEGHGSTFWCTVVLERVAETVGPRPDPAQDLANKHVLAVDDNAKCRAWLDTVLTAADVRVETASNGPKGLARVIAAEQAGDPFDAVLIDADMPGMGGVQRGTILKDLERRGATVGPALIILTTLAHRAEQQRLERAGFAIQIAKPIRRRELLRTLAEAIGGAERRENEAQGSSASEPSVEPRKSRVLVVEDNRINQMVAVGQLAKLGYRADTVANGREAIEALRALPYDLVLMDCQMPEMDGYEATRAIRQPDTGVDNPAVPIIAMTANTLREDRQKSMAAGMDDFVAKPVRIERLRATLGKWLPIQSSITTPASRCRLRAS